MRAPWLFAIAATVLLGCDQRGYAPVPQFPTPGVYPGYYGGWVPPPGAAPPAPTWTPAPRWPGAAAAPEPRGSIAAQVAMSLYGRPYCWGGTGPDCFDCSGLTFIAWRAAGVVIPRTSELQREKLTPIAMHELQPGDIVWRPGHVGLYVGNGWAIHAPGTGKVVQYQAATKFAEALRPYGVR